MTRPGGTPRVLVSANIKRHMFRARLNRLVQRIAGSWPIRFERRHPGLALWGLAGIAVALQAQVWNPPPKPPEWVPTEQDRCVERMARLAVGRSLDVIGHGVVVEDVRVRPLPDWIAAHYIRSCDEIEFGAGLRVAAEEIELTAAHEAVHAIFDQAELNPYSESHAWDTRLLVEETAAEVLSGHIVGRIRNKLGGDGDALVRRHVAEYRTGSTWGPRGRRRFVWLSSIHGWAIQVKPDHAYMIALHYGPPERVDAIDEICRANPDPWVAAHVIAERFIEPIEESPVPGLPVSDGE